MQTTVSNWTVTNFNTFSDDGAFARLLTRADDDSVEINMDSVVLSSSNFTKFVSTDFILSGLRDQVQAVQNITIKNFNVSNCFIYDSVFDIDPVFMVRAKSVFVTNNVGTGSEATIFRDTGSYAFADYFTFSSNSKLSLWQSFSVATKLWACRNFYIVNNIGSIGDPSFFVLQVDQASEFHFNDFFTHKSLDLSLS